MEKPVPQSYGDEAENDRVRPYGSDDLPPFGWARVNDDVNAA